MNQFSRIERILSAISAWVASRAMQMGIIEDETLNTLYFDGRANQTLSLHAALAEKKGKRWGCILCNILNVLVEKDHCLNTLLNKPMSVWDCVKALFYITIALGAPWAIMYCVLRFIF